MKTQYLNSTSLAMASELLHSAAGDAYAACICYESAGGIMRHAVFGAGSSTWQALLRACAGSRSRADRIAQMRIDENWTLADSPDAIALRPQYKAIEDESGEIVAYLFKR